MQKKIRDKRGFTLIEVLIVVVIIGFLASTIGPELFSRVSQAQRTTAQNQLDIFKMALNNYRIDNGRYPTTDQGLEALIKKPTSSPVPQSWNGPYLEKKQIPSDPWGNSYHYQYSGQHNSHSYDLWSNGADNQQGGTGDNSDVTNW